MQPYTHKFHMHILPLDQAEHLLLHIQHSSASCGVHTAPQCLASYHTQKNLNQAALALNTLHTPEIIDVRSTLGYQMFTFIAVDQLANAAQLLLHSHV